ncbi:MAG: tRNA (adenosine(37)-N6)-dimethylallyltransferase MiaA [Oscillospiraceae bacterium]|nr:tRNA (adenosine(37)-N6)-dimethylallyltransferase MiaA [Oscillospiraceae bacterium]
MTPEILVITGPTASGKTELGVSLAQKLGGEVVSADSMQIYKYMDIGTAKPTEEEMRGIPHHMLSVVSPFESYSVSRYVTEAGACVDAILSRGKLPILVGGTGLYIESLVLGRSFAAGGAELGVRAELERQYDEAGGERMLDLLRSLDPERAAKLHPNDKKRIVRALELAQSGSTISEHDELTKKAPPRYRAKYIVLGFEDREDLYRRIDIRVDVMLKAGLMDEVRALLDMGLPPEATAMQAIGYKESARYLRGEEELKDAVENIKRGSRRYAKRQISWCSRYEGALRINWKNIPDFADALHASTEFFAER